MVLYIFTTFPDLDNCKMELLSFVPGTITLISYVVPGTIGVA
jgi:hypothetical protein